MPFPIWIPGLVIFLDLLGTLSLSTTPTSVSLFLYVCLSHTQTYPHGPFLVKAHSVFLFPSLATHWPMVYQNGREGSQWYFITDIYNHRCMVIKKKRPTFSQFCSSPIEREMATQSSVLVWEIPRTEKPGGLQSTGSQRVEHSWVSEHAHMY